MKKFFAGVGVALALSVFAVSRPFSGTIDVPATMTWVDSGGNEIAPYAGDYYLAASGYVWTIANARSTTPTLTGMQSTGLGLLYTTTNCTGIPYLTTPDLTRVPHGVIISPADGLLYADGAAAVVTIASRRISGSCYLDTVATPTYYADGPLTPPVMSAGPWHLEAR